jgi:hypothetical protein
MLSQTFWGTSMLKVMQGMAFGLGIIVLICADQAHADIVKQQAPCSGGVCLGLTSGSTGVFTARTVNFAAPGAGTLIVSFHGALECTSNANTASRIVVSSQIVEDMGNPSEIGPSGVTVFHTIEAGNVIQRNATFSLNSHRVFKINSAATYTYRLRLTRNLPSDVFCQVNNGTLTTDFRQ